jgi:hypothetical protein
MGAEELALFLLPTPEFAQGRLSVGEERLDPQVALLRREFFPGVTKVVTFQVWDG